MLIHRIHHTISWLVIVAIFSIAGCQPGPAPAASNTSAPTQTGTRFPAASFTPDEQALSTKRASVTPRSTAIVPPPTITAGAAQQLTRRVQVRIDSKGQWQDTGVQVSSGSVVQIIATSGEWKWSSVEPNIGATGDTNPVNTCGHVCDMVRAGDPLAGRYCPRYNDPMGALIGRVGAYGGNSFLIGSSVTYAVPSNINAPQNIYMRMNDCDTGLYDNEGSISVTIAVFSTK